MSEKNLHIVSYDVPYPADYGGVFDLFYKIKSLNAAGVSIHLHCFEYGRGQQPELEKYCQKVTYYKRQSAVQSFTSSLPYIVSSRANPALLENLKKDDYPILMEGMHCTYHLHTGDLPGDRCFVRLPNVEFQYYNKLAETASSFQKRWFYKRESSLLKKYEKSLANKATFWTISNKDLDTFQHELGYKSVDNLPLYLPEYEPAWDGEKGSFCLYHGNLSVDENEFAATWLLENIFNNIEIPFVIAGKNPSKKLVKLAHKHMHTCLVDNPGATEMQEMIKKAQLNILPSFNDTGVKLKLINSLYVGRHCLVNSSAASGSGLEDLCFIANTEQLMREEVQRLYEIPFSYYTYEHRIEKLQNLFNNKKNARQMIGWIFEGEPTYPGYTMQQS